MELLDIVDEQNRIIGTAERNEAHEKKLLHRSVGVFIFRDKTKAEMMIQKRGKALRIAPGKWADVAGHISAGLSPRETILMELQEEAFFGMKMPDLDIEELFTFFKNTDDDPEFRTTFCTYYDGPFGIDGMEVEAWKWVKTREIIDDVERNPSTYSGTFRLVIHEALQRGIFGELIDIVDENNTVIGQLPIGEAYRRRAIKRQAGVLIFRTTAKDEMLIQLRSKHHKSMPNRWSIVSGVMDAGETPRACIERELVEEMFHNVQQPPKIAIHDLFMLRKHADDDPAFIMLFEAIYDGAFSLDPHEVANWQWIKIADLKKDVTRNPEKYTGTFREIFNEYTKRR